MADLATTQDAQPMVTDEELTWITDEHYEDEGYGDCVRCCGEWPCMSIRMVAELRSLRAERAAAAPVLAAAREYSDALSAADLPFYAPLHDPESNMAYGMAAQNRIQKRDALLAAALALAAPAAPEVAK